MGVANLATWLPGPAQPWPGHGKYALMARLTSILIHVFGLAVDVFLLIIPIPTVLRLKLSPRKKAGVLSIFLAGALAIVSGTVAMYYRVGVFRAERGLQNAVIAALCK